MKNIEFKEKWLLLAKVYRILSDDDMLMDIMNFLFYDIEPDTEDNPNRGVKSMIIDIIKDDLAN